ncbi:MAG: hypothetical protein HZA88_16565 [Verrucomicrobia bacterium]|nr:hypothetical protein [Verrucomicrobiota bacterium]
MPVLKNLLAKFCQIAWNVFQAFIPILKTSVAKAAAEILPTVRTVVAEANAKGGSGGEKYEYVFKTLSKEFGKSVGENALNLAIEAAVAETKK